MAVKKQLIKLVLTDSVIQELLQNKGGEVKINTSLYPDLNTVEQQYWKFHTPYGVPGDELLILEDYAIREVSQTAEGYFIVIEYRDGSKVKKQVSYCTSVTPKDCWLTANTMPCCYSRLHAVIQDIQMSVDNTQWIYVISQIVENTEESSNTNYVC